MLKLNNLHGFWANFSEGGHRYWDILIWSCAGEIVFNLGGASVELAALAVSDVEGGADIISGATLSASSNAGSVGNLTDANAATTWVASSAVYPQRITLDFGAGFAPDLKQVTMQAPSGNSNTPKDWDLRHSDDDVTYTTKWRICGEDQWSGSEVRTFVDPQQPSVPHVYSGSDPADILGANLKGWWPMDLLTGSNGDAKQIINDHSGNGSFLRQVVSGSAPLLVTNAKNSMNGLQFTVAGEEWINFPESVFGAGTEGTFYFVVKLATDPPSGGVGLLWMGPDNQADNWPNSSGSIIITGCLSSGRKTMSGTVPNLASQYRVITVQSKANDYRLYIDNTLIDSKGTNTFSTYKHAQLGRSLNSSVPLWSDSIWLEVIASDAFDSAGTMTNIYNYAIAKWAI